MCINIGYDYGLVFVQHQMIKKKMIDKTNAD